MDADVIVVGAGLAGLVAAAELADAGRRVLVVDQESAANLGGQAHWSFGGLFLVDSPEQRRMGIKDSVDLAWQDWQGSAGFDRLDDEDHWGAPVGPRLRRLRRRREALLAARAGHAVLPGRRAGPSAATGRRRATATRCPASTSSGAPAPGCWRRSCGASASTSPAGGWRSGTATGSTSWSPPAARSRACAAPCSHRTTAERGRPTNRDERRRVRADRPGGRRHQRWHRRQPRPGPGQLARAAGQGARAHAHRCPGARRRPHARRSPRPRAGASSTATGCGTTSRASRTGTRSGRPTRSASCPARARCGSTATATGCPAPLFPGLRHPRHACRTCARPGTTTAGSSSPRRSSARSSRSPGRSRTPTSPASRSRTCSGRARADMPGAGAGVPRQGRRLRLGRHPARAGRQDERPHPRRTAGLRAPRAPDRRPRPPDRQRLQQGRPGHGDPRRAKLPW